MKNYKIFIDARQTNNRLLAILVDPDKFEISETATFLNSIPKETTHIFVGGSTVIEGQSKMVVHQLKLYTSIPIYIFPGDHTQICTHADALLFLSLLSGRNAEYLIGQQVKAVGLLRNSDIEVIATGYILIDGNSKSAVERVTNTKPIPQEQIQTIVDTAKAGELMGAKLLYLEAGSGAKTPVSTSIIAAVKNEINIPLIVGGGIKTETQKNSAFKAGATMVVMGTVFENDLSV